ncbi:MAG: phosphatase PAP2 family protein [Bryobacteraceae bacterium]
MQQPIGVSVNVNFLVCLVLFLVTRPKPRELLVASAVGACLGFYLGLHGNILHRALEALSYCGAGAIPAVWLMPFLGGRSDLKLLGKLLFPPGFGILTTVFLNLGSHGVTYDNFLYAFDGSLGFQPSFWAGMVTSPPWINRVTGTLYDALPLFVVVAYLIEERRSAAAGRSLFFWILLVGLCGATCFFVFPAVGAYWIYSKSFPFHPPALSAVPVVPTLIAAAVPRNCMPSLHTAWALVALWAAGKCRFVWRMILRGLLMIMLLQTLVYHYFVDMVVAVPFTLALYALTRSTLPWSANQRRWPFGFGALSVVIWLVALRWGTALFQISPIVPWSAIVFTIASSWWLWRWLDRAVDAAPSAVEPALISSQDAG